MGKKLRSPFDLNHQQKDLDSKIVVALEKMAEVFRVLLWNEAKELKLSPIQLQILIFLKFHNARERKAANLAKEFNMTKPTISDAVKSLIEKDLVKKEVDTNDSRSFYLNLTEKGKNTAQRVALFSRELQTSLKGLDTSIKEGLFSGLLKLIENLNNRGLISRQRMCFGCHFYKGNKEDKHFCNLLKVPLSNDTLRVDCPEYKAI